MTYSVAIRTLGTHPEILKKELESLSLQSKQPEKVIIYIAEGYDIPMFKVKNEEYIYVRKGMVAQRALPYNEISSDCILLLDDDVLMEEDTVQKMMRALSDNNADCVGADIFRNHEMSVFQKVYAVITNLVFPHWDSHWAFKIHSNGSFSYNNRPQKNGFYWSESCGGPISLWKKSSLLRIRIADEMWMDSLGFAYDDDKLTFYKLICNGGKLGILYDAGVTNLDGKTSSADYHRKLQKYYIRSFMTIANWHRIIWSSRKTNAAKAWAVTTFGFKIFWLFIINILAGLLLKSYKVPSNYFLGCRDAVRFINSKEYKSIPSFVLY